MNAHEHLVGTGLRPINDGCLQHRRTAEVRKCHCFHRRHEALPESTDCQIHVRFVNVAAPSLKSSRVSTTARTISISARSASSERRENVASRLVACTAV